MEQVKLTWRDLIKDFFGVNEIEEDLTEELKKSHLYDTMNKLDKMAEAFNTPINCEENKSSKSGGFSAGLKSDTLGKMKDIADGKTTVKNQVEKNKPGIEKEI